MNGLLLLGITAVVLIGAYLLYGRYLVKEWGIDVTAKTPAVKKRMGLTMSRAINGRSLPTNFLLLPARVLSPVL